MKIDLNIWLMIFQLAVIGYAMWDHWQFRKWVNRCKYWRQLCVREQEFIDAAEKRDDYKAIEAHQAAFREYYESFKKELTK